MNSWIVSPLRRVYPATPPERSLRGLAEVARNERFSFQLAVRHDGNDPVTVKARVRQPRGWRVRIRRVGYVPIRHLNTDTWPDEVEGGGFLPGFAPDPLFDGDELLLPPGETHAFWFTVTPSGNAPTGEQSIEVSVTPEGGKPRRHRVDFRAHPVRIRKRRGFSVTHWFYLDALIDWYRTDLFDDRFWAILPGYLKNLADHGQDTLYVPTFTPPLDGIKRPSQLLKVRRKPGGGYGFDWSDVRRFLRIARECGIGQFEWCHLFTQWGAREAIRVYEGQGREERLLWPPETPATSTVYRRFLADYLPALRRFLLREGLEDVSYFHVSDEPHGDQIQDYRKARELLRELPPGCRSWMPFPRSSLDVRG